MPVSSTVTYFWILTCRKCDLWASTPIGWFGFPVSPLIYWNSLFNRGICIRIYSMNRALIASDSSLTPSLKNCFFSTEQLYLIVLHFLYKPRCLVYQTTTLDPVHHITCLIKNFIHPSFWIFRFWLFRYSPR